jgi:hypothetical protein
MGCIVFEGKLPQENDFESSTGRTAGRGAGHSMDDLQITVQDASQFSVSFVAKSADVIGDVGDVCVCPNSIISVPPLPHHNMRFCWI